MRPLVLLHGFLGAPASWAAVRAALPAGLEVHALGLSGHGAPVVASWDDEIARLDGEISRIAAGRPLHLAGYSLGGRLAIGLLATRPERYAQATLVSAAPGLFDATARAARLEADAAWAARLRDQGLDAFLDAWEAQPLFASQAALSPEARAAWRALRRGHDPAALAVGLGALSLGAMPDYRAALSRLALPVRVVAGALDPKFCALAAQLCDLLPRARPVLLPGAGHNLPLEAPRALASTLDWSPDEPDAEPHP